MNRRILIIAAVGLIAAGIFAMSSLFIVDQTEEALVLQFGQPRRVIRQPGLQVKRPFIENVIFYDNRLLDFEPPPEEVIVSDQKRLVVDTYTRYRITDPLLFYQTVSTEAAVRARLNAMVSGSLRRVLGNVTLSALLSHQRSAIMAQIRDEVSAQGKSFGINVIDVRIRRADLPEENSQAIFARMKSEREQQAAQYRGEGAEAAQTVRANAERERTVILAEAQRAAQKVRGDAVRIQQEAEAYKQEITARSQGDADRFLSVYHAFKAAQDVTLQRLYLETMEEILKNSNKVIIDKSAQGESGVLPYLPLPALGSGQGPASAAPAGNTTTAPGGTQPPGPAVPSVRHQ